MTEETAGEFKQRIGRINRGEQFEETKVSNMDAFGVRMYQHVACPHCKNDLNYVLSRKTLY